MTRARGGLAAAGLAILAGAALAGGDSQENAPRAYVLRAGLLYTGDYEKPLRDASMVVRNGRVELVREGGAGLPEDLPVVDRRDAVVMPGFVAAESGLSDAFEERNRGLQSGTVVVFRNVDPLRRAIDGFSFIERRDGLLASGVTTAYLAPGRARLVNGRGAVVKLAGADAKDRTLREVSDLSLSIGDAPENPPNYFDPPLPPSAENPIVPGRMQFPRARAGALFAIQRAFDEALALGKGEHARVAEGFEREMRALGELLRARVPVRVRTNADADALGAVALMKRYGLKGSIVGAREADSHASELQEARAGAIVEIPLVTGAPPETSGRAERPRDAARTAAALAAAKVPVAIVPAEDAQIGQLPLLLAAAVRGGMSRADAVRAVTRDAAALLGVEDRVGTLGPGRDADFLVLSGEPGEASMSVRETWVGGALVHDRAANDRARREAKKLPAPRGSVVVRAGWVVPVSGPPIRDGAVAIHDGRIVAVGQDVPVPRGARVIDAGPEAVVTPGLVDGRSFLGLEGDATPVSGATQLAYLAVPGHPDFRLAAAGGVTTAVVQGAQYQGNGTPIAALKTGGASADAVVREACGLGIPSQGWNADAYRAILRRGKDYTDRWDKYFAEADKAREDAKKAAAEGKKPEEKPAEPKKEEEAKPEKQEADPITGTWEGEIRGGPMPRPESFTMRMRLRGTVVSGTFSSKSPIARGQDFDFDNGKFENGLFTLTITRAEVPFPLKIEGKVDRPDHMSGTVNAQVIQLEFEASRTEKAAPQLAARPVAKKKGPEMPQPDDALEPFRRVFKGDAALVVRADSKADIETAIAVAVDEFKIPLVILGGGEADAVAPLMAAKKVGLLSGPNLPLAKSDLPAATEAAAAGVPVAFGTESGAGSSRIAEVGLALVAKGVGADTVLRAFTLDAARIFRIDSRVGSLEPGKDGDLVIWSGPPFRGDANIRTVVVGGEVIAAGEGSAR